jgi:hypothetical protein
MITITRTKIFSHDEIRENNMDQNRPMQELSQPVDEELELLEAEEAYDRQRSIQVAAYYLGMKRREYGRPGDELSDWLQAEKNIEEKLSQKNR